MRIKVAICCCVAFLGFAIIPLCGADTNWGPASGGFQAAIDMQNDPDAGIVLNVVLRNAGAETRHLQLSIFSSGPAYDIETIAIRGHDKVPVFDTRALSEPPNNSFPEYEDLRLVSGATYAFKFRLNSMIGVVNRKDVPLDSLLKQGYSLRASLQIHGTIVVTSDLAPMR
jgi:hypothetical protein